MAVIVNDFAVGVVEFVPPPLAVGPLFLFSFTPYHTDRSQQSVVTAFLLGCNHNVNREVAD